MSLEILIRAAEGFCLNHSTSKEATQELIDLIQPLVTNINYACLQPHDLSVVDKNLGFSDSQKVMATNLYLAMSIAMAVEGLGDHFTFAVNKMLNPETVNAIYQQEDRSLLAGALLLPTGITSTLRFWLTER